MLIDIKKCYQKLEDDEKQILMLRYHENLTLERIGEVLGCHRSSADRRCNHALRELNNLLGGASPYQ